MNIESYTFILTFIILIATLLIQWSNKRKEIIEKGRKYVKERINTEIGKDNFSNDYKQNIGWADVKEVFEGIYKLNDWYKKLGVKREIKNSNKLIRDFEYYWRLIWFRKKKKIYTG